MAAAKNETDISTAHTLSVHSPEEHRRELLDGKKEQKHTHTHTHTLSCAQSRKLVHRSVGLILTFSFHGGTSSYLCAIPTPPPLVVSSTICCIPRDIVGNLRTRHEFLAFEPGVLRCSELERYMKAAKAAALEVLSAAATTETTAPLTPREVSRRSAPVLCLILPHLVFWSLRANARLRGPTIGGCCCCCCCTCCCCCRHCYPFLGVKEFGTKNQHNQDIQRKYDRKPVSGTAPCGRGQGHGGRCRAGRVASCRRH